MKVKSLTRKAKQAICVLLTAAMVLGNAEAIAFAAEETETFKTEEASKKEEMEEMPAVEEGEDDTAVRESSNAIEENRETVTESSFIEEKSIDEKESDTIAAEEDMETSVFTEESETLTESSAIENDSKTETECNAAEETSDIQASGTYKDITWSIDSNGKLLVEGTGDFADLSVGDLGEPDSARAPWCEYGSLIKSAEINVKEMTDASFMFYGCEFLTNLDLSNFDTGKVTSMEWMFNKCIYLEKLDLRGFDTRNVTNMRGMFGDCHALNYVDLSSFNTDNVVDMGGMFDTCTSLVSLDLSGFNMENAVETDYLFWDCGYLVTVNTPRNLSLSLLLPSGTWNDPDGNIYTELPVGRSDSIVLTAKTEIVQQRTYKNITWSIDSNGRLLVEGTGDFADLSVGDEITDLARAPWHEYGSLIKSAEINVKGMTDASYMFRDCYRLISIDLSGFDTSTVTNMSDMFGGCRMYSIDLSGFDTSNVTNMWAMFTACSNLSYLDLSTFDTAKVTDMRQMFDGCGSLRILDLSSFDTVKVTDMRQMFDGCRSLRILDLSSFDTAKVTDMSYMFSGCRNLAKLDLSNFNMANTTNISDFFAFCDALINVYTPYNMLLSVTLPEGVWYDMEGNEYSELPAGMSDSILLAKGKVPEAADIHIRVSKKKTDYKCGDVISLDDLQVVYYGSDGNTRRLENNEYTTNISDIDTSVSGEKILTITYENGNDILTAEIKLTISERGGQYEDIVWDIDTNGKLTVTGTGEFGVATSEEDYWTRAPWYEDRESILSAEIDVSGIMNASCMFRNCSNLKSVDFINFDTSQVANMEHMFYGCSSLENLDVSGFDTRNVVLMDGMFEGCTSLKSLDVSGFQTGNVTWMAGMFNGCSSLESLEVNNFDTSQVGKFNDMFWDCSNLKNIDLSGFDTGNAIDMHQMFRGCSSLTSINLSGFDTRNVTDMHRMFDSCDNLRSIDLSGFDTRNVTDMHRMFYGCSSLQTIDVSCFDTSCVANMQHMFRECNSLRSITFGSGFDTCQVTNIGAMFRGCSSLSNIDVSGFDTRNATSMNGMFYGCSSLTSLDVSGFDTENVADMNNMFVECSSLTSLDLSGFDTRNVTKMAAMFKGCSNLTSLDLSGFDTGNVTEMNSMFSGCSNLMRLDVSSFHTENVTVMKTMFNDCKNLTSLDMSSFNVKNVTDMTNLFKSCDALVALNTPYNVSIMLELPVGTWRDAESNIYTALPKDRSDSILLTREKNKITAVKTKTAYECSDIINIDDINVTYYGSGGMVKILESSEYTTNAADIDTSVSGEKILKIIYSNEYEFLTANIKLVVSKKEESSTEESSIEESSAVEGSSVEESNAEKESSAEESSAVEESGGEEESSVEESSTDKDDSAYEDSERDDLRSLNATISNIKAKIYDGSAYEPVVTVTAVKDGKKITLMEGADYHVLYKNNINAGTGTVIVRGNGRYKGEIDKDFTISAKPVKKLKVVTGSLAGNVSDDTLSILPVYVYDGTKLLQYDKDYVLSDYRTVKVSSAQVTVKATENGNYTGSVTAKLTVYQEDAKIINLENVVLENEEVFYTGKAIKNVEPIVTVSGTLLTKGKDYTVQYQNNKDVGTAFIIVTGKGEYKGKVIIPFTIKAKTVPSDAIMIKSIPAKTYNGKLQKPSVTVSVQKDDKAKKLTQNKDYTVSYENNFHAGTATVVVKGKGNYEGLAKKVNFVINPQKIAKASVKGDQGNLVLTYGKNLLKEGSDYEPPVYGIVNKNKVQVTIRGKGDFTGEVTKKIKTQSK